MLHQLRRVLVALRVQAGIAAGGLVRGEVRTKPPAARTTDRRAATAAACDGEEHADERPVRDWLAANGWRGALEVVGIVALAFCQAAVDGLRHLTRRSTRDRRRP